MSSARVVVRSTEIRRTPRVLQIEGMFDVPPSERQELEWQVNLPLDEKKWSVGLIVGPSGAGKSTVAREIFGEALVESFDWPEDLSIVDAFPSDMPIKTVASYLTSVGLGSVPAWLRPYHVLSTGEKFRATLARALAEAAARGDDRPVVIDEFTSVVDRQVAKFGSHAIQKTVRRSGLKFVAVTCHYDVIDWLQPDWIFQPHTGDFQWRSLQRRPEIRLEIHKIDRSAWRLFRDHHYMSPRLHPSAECFGAFIGDECVAFASYIHFPHPRAKNIMMGHRLVVLPDYQGVGIGGRLDDWIGQYLYERGYRYHNTVSHPAMIAYYKRSPRWRLLGAREKLQTGRRSKMLRRHLQARTLTTVSFQYVPPKKGE